MQSFYRLLHHMDYAGLLSGAFAEDGQRRYPAFVLFFAVFDETKSWYGQVGERVSRERFKRTNGKKEYHTINGYVNATLPGDQRAWLKQESLNITAGGRAVMLIAVTAVRAVYQCRLRMWSAQEFNVSLCVCSFVCRFDNVSGPKPCVLAPDRDEHSSRNPHHSVSGSFSDGNLMFRILFMHVTV